MTSSARRRGSSSARTSDGRPSSVSERSRSSARKLPNWTRSTTLTSTPTAVILPLSSDVVGEPGCPEGDADDREQRHRLLLREAVVDEPVRRVVLAALRDGPPLPEPRDRDERRVEDRDCEHDQRQHHGGDRGAGGRPARREPEAREGETEHLAAGVAHEHLGPASEPEVVRKKPEAREPEREG